MQLIATMPHHAASTWDRILRPFSRVEPGEGLGAVLMLVCIFLILASYYLMKTAREGLVLASGTWGLGGNELKAYANGAMAILLVGAIPAYGALASRVGRLRLITVSYLVVIACLGAFWGLGRAGVSIGLPFFVWIGLINVFLVAQFWSYANDLYREEQGKRLFGIIAIGGSLGALAGPLLSELGDTFALLLGAAALLIAALAMFHLIERVHARRPAARGAAAASASADEPIAGGGFSLVLSDRYLLLIAAMCFVANLVNTTGEFVLSTAVTDHAAQLATTEAARRELIKDFYGTFFFWVNLIGFVVQAFLVSRVIEKFGVRRALYALPIIALGSYGLIGAAGGLALIRIAKIAENATDYSLQNTARQALFLPTGRDAKYKAKAAIDTFFVRAGDTLSAIVVAIGVHELHLGARAFAVVNLALVTVWLAIVVAIGRRHRRRVDAPRDVPRRAPAPRHAVGARA